jgi:hypothetical protein
MGISSVVLESNFYDEVSLESTNHTHVLQVLESLELDVC